MLRLRGIFLGIGVALSVISMAMAATPGAAEILGQHTVQRGETLFCIARAYGVDPWAIADQNQLVEVSRIHSGLVLQIPNVPRTLPAGPSCKRQFGESVIVPQPAPAPACTCTRTHLIATGDTLTAIGLKYGVSTWIVASCNRLQNPNYIRIGDTLCIP